MLGEHGIGDSFSCDYCAFLVGDKGLLRNHIEKDHQTKFETCGGNCSDRMYDENTFKCVNCETFCVLFVLNLITGNCAGDVTLC